jgi:hypothetical protein
MMSQLHDWARELGSSTRAAWEVIQAQRATAAQPCVSEGFTERGRAQEWLAAGRMDGRDHTRWGAASARARAVGC